MCLPLKVGDVLIVALAADVNDFGEQLIPVCGPLSLVNMQHQLLHNLHQVLLRDLHIHRYKHMKLIFSAHRV